MKLYFFILGKKNFKSFSESRVKNAEQERAGKRNRYNQGGERNRLAFCRPTHVFHFRSRVFEIFYEIMHDILFFRVLKIALSGVTCIILFSRQKVNETSWQIYLTKK
jgi:hypothetical protein